jgi:hypothetical protein
MQQQSSFVCGVAQTQGYDAFLPEVFPSQLLTASALAGDFCHLDAIHPYCRPQ